MRSAEFQRGYEVGYKQALLDAVRDQGRRVDALERRTLPFVKLGGPDAPYKRRQREIENGEPFNAMRDGHRIR